MNVIPIIFWKITLAMIHMPLTVKHMQILNNVQLAIMGGDYHLVVVLQVVFKFLLINVMFQISIRKGQHSNVWNVLKGII